MSLGESEAISLGLKPLIHSNKVKGEAGVVGKNILKNFKKLNKKNCLLFAGETTVTVRGNGKGGRNQELCLGAIKDISRLKDIVLVSVGSDGIEGTTDAAGAIVDNNSLSTAKSKGIDVKSYLDCYDSNTLLRKISRSLIITSNTGTNVGDVIVYILK